MTELGPRYRFPKGAVIPEAPMGKVVTKFHGKIEFISEPKPGEPVNKAGFTPTQERDLHALEIQRITARREELLLC